MFEGGDVSLVDSSEVDEEHVHAASQAVRLLGGASNVDVGCGMSEEWRCNVDARVPLAEGVVYLAGRRERPGVERVEAVVCVVAGDESGATAVVMDVEDRDGVV